MEMTVRELCAEQSINVSAFTSVLDFPIREILHKNKIELRRLLRSNIRSNVPDKQIERTADSLTILVSGFFFHFSPYVALDLEAESQSDAVLHLGDVSLDGLFAGGLRGGSGITEFYGAAGSGKTQFCLQLCMQAQLPVILGGLEGDVVFVSSEAFPSIRISQLNAAYRARKEHSFYESHSFEDGIFVELCGTYAEQNFVIFQRIPLLFQHRNIRLVVIDSIGALTRVEYDVQDTTAKVRDLFRVAQHLKKLSAYFRVPIVVTNQVTARFPPSGDQGEIAAALGMGWSHCVNTRVRLKRLERVVNGITLREAMVELSPCVPQSSVLFSIEADGVHGVELLAT